MKTERGAFSTAALEGRNKDPRFVTSNFQCEVVVLMMEAQNFRERESLWSVFWWICSFSSSLDVPFLLSKSIWRGFFSKKCYACKKYASPMLVQMKQMSKFEANKFVAFFWGSLVHSS